MNTKELRNLLEKWNSNYKDAVKDIVRKCFEDYNNENAKITRLSIELLVTYIELDAAFDKITNYIDFGNPKKKRGEN